MTAARKLPTLCSQHSSTRKCRSRRAKTCLVEQLKEAFDVIYRDSEKSGRLLVLNVHPWLMGQSFRIDFLDEALRHMVRRQGVWCASGSEIIEAYRRSVYTQ